MDRIKKWFLESLLRRLAQPSSAAGLMALLYAAFNVDMSLDMKANVLQIVVGVAGLVLTAVDEKSGKEKAALAHYATLLSDNPELHPSVYVSPSKTDNTPP